MRERLEPNFVSVAAGATAGPGGAAAIMLVTHDLDLRWRAADRVEVLGKTHIVAAGTMTELSRSDDPLVTAGRAVAASCPVSGAESVACRAAPTLDDGQRPAPSRR
jgi:ABC-type glutathione transport system ATPase component